MSDASDRILADLAILPDEMRSLSAAVSEMRLRMGDLGTIGERVDRVEELLTFIARRVGSEGDESQTLPEDPLKERVESLDAAIKELGSQITQLSDSVVIRVVSQLQSTTDSDAGSVAALVASNETLASAFDLLSNRTDRRLADAAEAAAAEGEAVRELTAPVKEIQSVLASLDSATADQQQHLSELTGMLEQQVTALKTTADRAAAERAERDGQIISAINAVMTSRIAELPITPGLSKADIQDVVQAHVGDLRDGIVAELTKGRDGAAPLSIDLTAIEEGLASLKAGQNPIEATDVSAAVLDQLRPVIAGIGPEVSAVVSQDLARDLVDRLSIQIAEMRSAIETIDPAGQVVNALDSFLNTQLSQIVEAVVVAGHDAMETAGQAVLSEARATLERTTSGLDASVSQSAEAAMAGALAQTTDSMETAVRRSVEAATDALVAAVDARIGWLAATGDQAPLTVAALDDFIATASDIAATAAAQAVTLPIREATASAVEIAAASAFSRARDDAGAAVEQIREAAEAAVETAHDAAEQATAAVEQANVAIAQAQLAAISAVDELHQGAVDAAEVGRDALHQALMDAGADHIREATREAIESLIAPTLRSAGRATAEAAARGALEGASRAKNQDALTAAVTQAITAALGNPEGLSTAMIGAVAQSLDEFGQRVEKDLDEMGSRLSTIAAVLEGLMDELTLRRRTVSGGAIDVLREVAAETTQDVAKANTRRRAAPRGTLQSKKPK